MPTVLVPLDESAFAESILPDAEQLAGPDGQLVLVSVLAHHRQGTDQMDEKSNFESYLANEAQSSRVQGLRVETRVQVGSDIPRAIDEAIAEFGAEMVALATHGTERVGWLARSSIAWKTLAHSPVPVLVRHTKEGRVRDSSKSGPRAIAIMVSLDGSPRGKQALPVAAALAKRWQGSLVLVQVASEATGGSADENEEAANLMLPVVEVDSIRSGGHSTGGRRISIGLRRIKQSQLRWRWSMGEPARPWRRSRTTMPSRTWS